MLHAACIIKNWEWPGDEANRILCKKLEISYYRGNGRPLPEMLAKLDVNIVYSKHGMMIKSRGVYKSQCHNIIVI